MPNCPECHSYINGLVVIRMHGGLICPECMTIIADDPSTLAEWTESQDEAGYTDIMDGRAGIVR